MSDMRKLMESVAPLFENPPELVQMLARFEDDCNEFGYYGDTDVVTINNLIQQDKLEDAAEEMAGAMADQDGGSDRFDEIFELAKEMLEDLYVAEDSNDMMEAEPMAVDSDLERLQEIMDELENLGMEAKSLMVSIDPEKARTLDAYGAFNFGSSDNEYNTTFANAVGELVDGDDNMAESADTEACSKCGKRKHVLKACASCGCS